MTPRQYDRKHLNNLSDLDRRIARLFDQTINEIARWGILMDKPIGDKPFSFADYPHIKKRMDQLFDQFKSQTSTAIRNSLEREDALSADKAADLAVYYGQALNAQRSAAVQQIANRIVGGMNLSERIWHISDSFYKEIETALDIALRDGTPADRLATELKQYLRHPDKLFRRVRDEHGQLRLSKAAQAYHPGQGVYRSSFRNARRLAVTETNMAYHAADHERWQALDFVLGYEVQVSGTNPNVCPLCMELAGKYPKEFKFVGWHPHCRCHALPILEKPQAFKARQQALLRGERIPPIGAVKAPPDNFTAHLANNTDRIASAQRNGTLPYYLRDNYKVAKDGTLTPTFKRQPIEAQKLGTYGNKLGRKAAKEAQVALADHKTLDNFSEAQMKNFEEINRTTGYKRGKVMSFEEADHGQSNISRDIENCASCVVVHEMRLRGYDITALRFNKREGSISKLLSEDTRSIWITAKGKTPEFTALIGGEPEDIIKAIEKQTQPIGSRYHIGWDISKKSGHVVTAERTANGLVIYDPQRDTFLSLEGIVKEMIKDSKIQLLRVDRLLLRDDLLGAISSTLK